MSSRTALQNLKETEQVHALNIDSKLGAFEVENNCLTHSRVGINFPIRLCEFNAPVGYNKLADSQKNKDEADVKQGLLAAYRRFMGPLVRILIRNGISFNEFADELKGVFVEIAHEDFPIDGRNPSGTRIAILTGLTRKEVKKQLEKLDGGTPNRGSEGKTSRVSRVLDCWHADPRFTGPYSMPLELQFDDSDGRGPCFTELVKKYSGDMSARAMLDEFVRLGVVEILDGESIRALTKYHIAADLDEEALSRMGTVIKNLADTLDHNFNPSNAENKRFERNVYTGIGISEPALKDFSKLVGEKGDLFIQTLDNFLSAHEGKDDQNNKANIKTGVEIYHYIQVDE